MAERIEPFTPRSGRPPSYPWDEWMDGSTWRIERGVDFEIPARNMAAVIRARGHRVGQLATTRVIGDSVEFRFALAPQERAA